MRSFVVETNFENIKPTCRVNETGGEKQLALHVWQKTATATGIHISYHQIWMR